jgi:hypothetical protein
MRHSPTRKRAQRELHERRNRKLRRRSRRGGTVSMGPCGNLRVCVVGNGPSAEGNGEAIDGHDFVVRTSIFPLALRGAGTKLNAWCWNGAPKTCPKRMSVPPGRYETWLSVHTSYRKLYKQFLRHANRLARKHGPLRVMSERTWIAMRAAVRCHPSTGFAAVAYALEHLRPKTLTLYGFDATRKGAPGWGDARKTIPWRVAKAGHVCGHNLLLEKQLLYRLMKRGEWFGMRCKTKVVWPARPKGAKA